MSQKGKIVATWSPCCGFVRTGFQEPGVMHSGLCCENHNGILGPTVYLTEAYRVPAAAGEAVTVEVREFACWDGPEEAPLVRKWVPLEEYERLEKKCAALALLVYPVHPDPTGKTREPPHCPTCDCNAEPQSAEHKS